MYQESDRTEIHRCRGSKWTDTFKRLTTQRVAPSNDGLSSSTKEYKAVAVGGADKMPSTPELSVTIESAYASSEASSLLEPDLGPELDIVLEEENRELNDGDADDEAEPTYPDLSLMMDRPLPPLPGMKRTKTSARIASEGQRQLKRASTWLGLAGQKIIQATPQVQQQVQHLGQKISQKSTSFHNLLRLATSTHDLPMDEVEDENSFAEISSDEEESVHLRIQTDNLDVPASQINKKTLIAPKRFFHCKVSKIINSASPRDCEYELQIQLNNTTLTTVKGMLHKADKTGIVDALEGTTFTFEVEDPCELNFVMFARHTNLSLKEGLSRLSIWPKSVKEEKMTVVGHKTFCLESSSKELSRFKLINPDSQLFNIEVFVDVREEEILPALVEQFPWAFTTNASSAVPVDEDNIMTADPFQLPLSQDYCCGGDYLTIYTRGLAHPIWRRFWVTMKDDQLSLYDFTYKKQKEPLYTIPLVPLLNCSKPSFDDYENVGISKKTGLVLYFNKNHAVLNEPVRLVEEEGLEGKAFIYADSEQGAVHWRRALGAYISNEHRAAESEERIDLRFLW